MVYKICQIGLGFSLLLLSACSTIGDQYHKFVPDRETVYLEAEANNPLVLPEGMVLVENQQSPYIIPAGPLPGEDAEPMNLVPPGGQALWDRAKAQVAQQEARAAQQENDE